MIPHIGATLGFIFAVSGKRQGAAGGDFGGIPQNVSNLKNTYQKATRLLGEGNRSTAVHRCSTCPWPLHQAFSVVPRQLRSQKGVT